MCGIFGVVNGLAREDKRLSDYMKDAAVAGMLRGRDGTGAFQVASPYSSDYSVFKTKNEGGLYAYIGPAKDRKGGEILNKAGKSFLTIGHHRAATSGEVSDDNAHPFEYYRKDDPSHSLVGVHNGTLRLFGERAKQAEKFAVDSSYLMHELTLSDDYAKTLSDITGAIATVFWCAKSPEKFYMYTNGERPLAFAFVSGQPETMLIASEAEMLYWLATRNKISLLYGEVLLCAPRQLYTFDNTGKLSDYTSVNVPYVTSTYNPEVFADDEDDYRKFWNNIPSGPSCSVITNFPDSALKKAAMAAVAELTAMTDLESAIKEAIEETKQSDDEALKELDKVLSEASPTKITLKDLGLQHRQEVVFTAEDWKPSERNPDVGTLTGLVELDTDHPGYGCDIFNGMIRGIKREDAEMWIGQAALARAVATFIDRTTGSMPLDVGVICSHPHAPFKADVRTH